MQACCALRLIIPAILIFVSTAEAQRPAPEARVIVGWAGFPDDGWLHHAVVGGSVRYYLTRRIAVEPEITYMRGPGRDRDVTLVPQLSFDFRPGEQVRPYLIGGFGRLYHRDTFYGWRGGSNTFNFGVGVRTPLTKRIYIAPEFRVGWEPFMRAGAAIGFMF